MISLTKEEIFDYLKDYSVLLEQMKQHPDIKLATWYNGFLYTKTKENKNTWSGNMGHEYVYRVKIIINMLKKLSYLEDSLFDSIDNSLLNFERYKQNIKDGGIFLEGDGKEFGNKQIVKLIRDAFNHNDNPKHSKFNISRNGKYIEVHLLDVRTKSERQNNPETGVKPFHVKIELLELSKMIENVQKSIDSLHLTWINNDNFDYQKLTNYDNLSTLKVVRLLFPKHMDKNLLDKINEINQGNIISYQEKLIKLKEIFDNNKLNFNEPKQYFFSNFQIEYLRNKFSELEKCTNLSKNSRLNIIQGTINETLSSGTARMYTAEIDTFLSIIMAENPYLSFNQITVKYINEALNNKESILYKRYSGDLYSLLKIYYFNDMVVNSVVDCMSYFFSNIYTEDLINIEGVEYERRHIRNALVHGRWFVSDGNVIELYDAKSGVENDYNFYWHTSIPLHAFTRYIEHYLKINNNDLSLK